MQKVDLVRNVAEKSEVTIKEANQVINVLFAELTECMAKGDAILIPGFGTFTSIIRAEREGRNPQTQEMMTIQRQRSPKFKASLKLKKKMEL